MVNYPNYGYGANSMPTATQPYGYPFNPYTQPVTPQAPQSQLQKQVDTNKIYVSGIEDVKMRVLPPNSEYIFLDNEKSLLYQKKVDANGQFEVKAYEISEYKSNTATVEQTSIDLSNYVPRHEFTALQDEIKALDDKISKLTTRSASNGTTSQPTPQVKPSGSI